MPRDFISNIEEANQLVATLDTDITTVRGELQTAQTNLTAVQGDLAAANTKVGEVQAELTKANGDLTAANQRISDLTASSRTAAQQAVTIVAQTGTKPAGSEGGGAKTQDFSKLKGLAKAQAAAQAKANGTL